MALAEFSDSFQECEWPSVERNLYAAKFPENSSTAVRSSVGPVLLALSVVGVGRVAMHCGTDRC